MLKNHPYLEVLLADLTLVFIQDFELASLADVLATVDNL